MQSLFCTVKKVNDHILAIVINYLTLKPTGDTFNHLDKALNIILCDVCNKTNNSSNWKEKTESKTLPFTQLILYY